MKRLMLVISMVVMLVACPTEEEDVAVESVAISGSATATVNLPQQYTATITPSNAADKTVTWSIESGDAIITANGFLTANVTGSVTIKVVTNNGKTDTKTITVNPEIPNTVAADNTAITAARTALIDADLGSTVYNQSQGNTQADVKTVIEGLIDDLDLEAEHGVTITITGVSFTAAIEGTVGVPNGTNGTCTFLVGISKGQGSAQNAQVTIVITATPYEP